ncbi:iron complex outermembrane receptor protein [Saonia flava]|uniref:Iron complex outermembrane receptor protein n=1 Tax=Saonia flava TaxID=523696 RepID=A0A846QV29_9FLAO|nr:TonB-dependent receptor [Saonia flava]NJB71077.1 iron complex outermembrane receptor protein [Saonia flava]
MNSLTIKQFIKLTFNTFCFLIIIAMLNPVLAADARGQKLENFKVDITVKDASVIDVLKDIENQTSFKFVYDRKIKRLRNTYDIAYDNVSLRSVLELMAKDANLTFRRINKTIAIDLKPKTPIRVVEILYKTVTGKVTDDSGMPLAGATILEKGTLNGTTTDFDGNFTIDVADDAILEISYLGFTTLEIPVNGNTNIDVQLIPDATQLEDVVVVGYGVQRKSDVTGSISSLKSESFNKGVVTNPGQLLQGKIAGVNVTAVSGEPGASQNIIIRGVGSLRSGTTPLFVVDGFVIDNSSTGVSSNPLNFINPQDIASIDVLKDASAAAIYGARAANGVIVITTKRGKVGRTEMNLSISTAMSSLANEMDVFSADQFRQQVPASGGTLFDGGATTDWQDQLTRTGISKNINFSMSGGTSDKFNYYVSTGVDDQEGIFSNSSLKRYSGRINLTQKALQGRLKVDFNLTASKTINERADAGAMVVDMLQLNPTIPVFTNGEPTLLDERLNPIVRNQIYLDEANNNRILANISPSLEIIKGLTYKLNLGVDYSSTNRDVQQTPYALLEGYEDGYLNTSFTTNSNVLVENTLTYTYDQGDHAVILLAGHSYQETEFEQKAFELDGFADNGIEPRYQDQISTEILPTTVNSIAFNNEQQSFFGRLNYGYADKYLLTATMRADGSSKFGTNNKYGYFPSVALGWNLSKEDFMQDNSFISNLKLRASWGQTGNQDGIPSKVSLASYVDSKTENDTYPLNGNEVTLDDYPFGTVPVRTAYPDLKWEVSTQTNIGLDFGLFKNSLTGTLDYFNKVASDVVLFSNRIDPIQPTEKVWTNIPDLEIKNSGVEISLDYNGNINEDLTFNIGGNLSYTDNKVVNSQFEVLTTGAATGAGQTGATINGYINNQPIGTYFMKEFIGIGDDGLNQFRDVVADGESLDNDRLAVGSALPDILYAFYLNFNYKNFDLGLNFNGVSGNKIYNHTAMSLFSVGQLSRNLNTTDFAIAYANEDTSNSNEVSTRYLEDGSFLRLNNATLGYSLSPEKVGFGDWVENIRFTLTGQNLFVISDYSGFDPEVNTGGAIDGIQTFGIDRFTYPSPRTFLFGLNVSF